MHNRLHAQAITVAGRWPAGPRLRVGRLGRASAWAARWLSVAHGRGDALDRAARCGPAKEVLVFIIS